MNFISKIDFISLMFLGMLILYYTFLKTSDFLHNKTKKKLIENAEFLEKECSSLTKDENRMLEIEFYKTLTEKEKNFVENGFEIIDEKIDEDLKIIEKSKIFSHIFFTVIILIQVFVFLTYLYEILINDKNMYIFLIILMTIVFLSFFKLQSYFSYSMDKFGENTENLRTFLYDTLSKIRNLILAGKIEKEIIDENKVTI
jgi:hypothetical protein